MFEEGDCVRHEWYRPERALIVRKVLGGLVMATELDGSGGIGVYCRALRLLHKGKNNMVATVDGPTEVMTWEMDGLLVKVFLVATFEDGRWLRCVEHSEPDKPIEFMRIFQHIDATDETVMSTVNLALDCRFPPLIDEIPLD